MSAQRKKCSRTMTPGTNVYKTFYCGNLLMFKKARAFVPRKPCRMFASKVGAYPSEIHFRCSALSLAPGLTHKPKTYLERPTTDKLYNLLWTFVTYVRKKFYNIWLNYNWVWILYLGRLYTNLTISDDPQNFCNVQNTLAYWSAGWMIRLTMSSSSRNV